MHQTAVQSAETQTDAVREQTWAAYLLAWVAAFSDAIGFLTLQQLGASYMSGNSMTMGVALGRVEWPSVLNHGLPIVSFVFGLLVGALLLLQLRSWHVRSAFAAVFGLEALCMVAFFLVGNSALQKGVIPTSQPSVFYTCMVLLTLAMGLQTATIRKISGQGVRTTFITGVLSDLTDTFIRYVSWLRTQARAQGLRQAIGESIQQTAFRNLLLLGGVWACYLVGAACGSFLEALMSLGALVFPIGTLAVLIAVDLVRPFDS